MLANFFNKTIIIKRLKKASGKKTFSATATADGHYQNVDSREAASLEGIAGKTYVAYFDENEDVQEGDRLVDKDTSQIFKVLSTERIAAEFGLETDHLEVIMEKTSN